MRVSYFAECEISSFRAGPMQKGKILHCVGDNPSRREPGNFSGSLGFRIPGFYVASVLIETMKSASAAPERQ